MWADNISTDEENGTEMSGTLYISHSTKILTLSLL